VGGVVALLVAGGAVALFTGGDDGGPFIDLPGLGNDEPETPEFAFEVRKVVPETTSATKAKELIDPARKVADQVKAVLDTLYVQGFVEPDAWGDFGAIEQTFDDDARAQAETDLDALTLGAAGAETYSFLQPERGVLVVDVLTDEGDAPVQALAFASFTGLAEGPDGAFTQIQSKASFFLHKVDGEWRIYSYRVDRKDRPAEAPATSTPAGSPSEAAS